MNDPIQRYLADGFTPPLRLLSTEAARSAHVACREAMQRPGLAPVPDSSGIEGRLLSIAGGAMRKPFVECRHLDDAAVRALCLNNHAMEVAYMVLGNNLKIWRSTLIEKPAGGAEFAWHQDFGGVFGRDEAYGLEPPVHLTIWLALTDVTIANGCMQFVPGVRRVLPSHPASPEPNAALLVDTDHVDAARAVPIELAAGEAVIFSDRALHGSLPNSTDAPRLGLAVRVTCGFVQVRPLFSGHNCLPVTVPT